ncbi:hypothetical protein M433DRAFT_152336 [Acidomyces richmondensis BFW]|nr:MAG: hypothetical protein FE78DRAFT_87294 [Acidomyces sp. 'richmondensis']KYG47389.1 hypothetical protein M433DRAFT_152336 [Acidomyces richmondensis BFW]
MSVPQFVKRRYSTMFMGSPPWSYENTDDGQFPMLTSFDVPTSAAVPYKELHARAGYPPSRRRTPSPLKMPADSDQVREDTARGLDELKPEDTVPALFSSPKYAVFEGDRGETVKKCLQASGECSPPPPELVFDDGSEVDIVTNHYNMPDTPETEAPPSSEGVDDQYRTLRCPQCQALLKWTQLDNSNHIELRLQRCPLSCSEKQPKNTSGLFSETEVPVQVNRGAW